jgi:ligand-binding sensor domain-containing protein
VKQKVILIALGLTIAWAVPPRASAQWVQTNGPDGGIVTSLFSAGSNLFAQTERGSALFRSEDSGAEWSAASAVLADAGVICFASLGTTLFAGTNDSGVFLSTDNGITWNPADTGLPPQSGVSALAVVGTTLFAGTDNGTFFSTNNGTSWIAVDSGLEGNTISAFAIIDTNGSSPMLFAGTYGGGVVLLTAGDSIWASVSTGLNNDNINALLACDTDLVAETSSGIVLSTTEGANWISITPNLPANNYLSALGVVGTDIFVGTNGAGVLRSTDEGTSWASAGLTNTPIYTFTTIGTELFAGTYDGVFLSTDNGASWTSEVNGMINTAVTAFAVTGPNLVAGTYDGGVFLSNDDGSNWLPADSNVMSINFEALQAMGSKLFAGTLEGVFLSTDNGRIWQTDNTGLPDSASINSFAEFGTYLLAVTSNGVFRSTDPGVSWIAVDSGLMNADIRVIATAAANGSPPMLVAGGYHGVFLSSDSGISWAEDSFGNDLNIFSIAVLGENTSSPMLFAGTGDGIFLSTDRGISWSASGLDDDFINSTLVVGSNLFAGTLYDGVFLSTNSGNSWVGVNEGLMGSNVTSLVVDSTNVSQPTLFAGINGSGVWRRPLSEMIASYAVESTPSMEGTISAYPNPFIRSATITFSSQESGPAEVTIVNLLGSEVAHLFKGEMAAGEHSFLWDSDGMVPGVYECIVHLNGIVKLVPLVLIR